MNRNVLVIAVVILAVTGMLLTGKYLSQRSVEGQAGNGTGDAVGALAPDFQLTTLDGKQVKLSDLRGQAVLLNFWATWCAPCKIEIPWFVELQKQYGPQGLQIVGVVTDVDAGKDAISKFAQEMHMDYPVLLSTDHVIDEYGGVQALPTTFYIGRDGKITGRVFGLIGHGEIEENIQKALKSGQAGAAATPAQQPARSADSRAN